MSYCPPTVCQPLKEPHVFDTVRVPVHVLRPRNPQPYVYVSEFVVYADPNQVRYRVWPEQLPTVVSPTLSV